MSTEQEVKIQKPEMQKKKFKFNMPHVIIVMLIMMVIAWAATWVVPAGQYQRVQGPEKRMVVVPDSFKYTESHPVSAFKFFVAVPQGMTEAAMVAFTIFIVAGAWSVIHATGAITVGLDKIVKRLKGKEYLAIILVMLICASVAAFIGALELAIVYVPVIIPLALALKLDVMTATAMALVASNGAFSASLTNPFSVGLGQTIAGLPLYSGIWYRWIVLIVFTAIGMAYVIRYAKKVKADPINSLVYEENKAYIETAVEHKEIEHRPEHTLIGIVLLVGFAAIIYGVLKLQWYMYEIGAIFFIWAIVIGLVGKLSLNQIAEEFEKGCKGVVIAAIAVGLSRSVLVIIEQAGIIDTIIMALVTLVKSLPGSVTAIGILIAQSLFNFVVPSSSGMAIITMPILAPLSDMVGITRQTTVLATQLGDGITNILYPVSGVLMACLAYTKIPYGKWFKFIMPLIIIWTVVGAIFLIIAQAIKYGPF